VRRHRGLLTPCDAQGGFAQPLLLSSLSLTLGCLFDTAIEQMAFSLPLSLRREACGGGIEIIVMDIATYSRPCLTVTQTVGSGSG
jgi:hypothetical protein